jgi:hypothetical protein
MENETYYAIIVDEEGTIFYKGDHYRIEEIIREAIEDLSEDEYDVIEPFGDYTTAYSSERSVTIAVFRGSLVVPGIEQFIEVTL